MHLFLSSLRAASFSLLSSGAVASNGQAGGRVKANSTQVLCLVETGVRQVGGRGMLRYDKIGEREAEVG